jgi:hypothetical protein
MPASNVKITEIKFTDLTSEYNRGEPGIDGSPVTLSMELFGNIEVKIANTGLVPAYCNVRINKIYSNVYDSKRASKNEIQYVNNKNIILGIIGMSPQKKNIEFTLSSSSDSQENDGDGDDTIDSEFAAKHETAASFCPDINNTPPIFIEYEVNGLITSSKYDKQKMNEVSAPETINGNLCNDWIGKYGPIVGEWE